MSSIAGLKPVPRGAWGAEAASTLSLAWPLVLTNLAQMRLATTDVVMMGWLGPDALAAGALGANLNFAFLIFGIGLVTATSPLIAIELGRKRHSVRDVRRTVRQGMWARSSIAVPIWIVLWQAEAILLAIGQEPRARPRRGGLPAHVPVVLLPFLVYLVLRNFVSALERPLVGALDRRRRRRPQRVPRLGADVRPPRPSGARPARRRASARRSPTSSCSWRLAFLISIDRRFRRYHLFGRFWRPDWPRFRHIWRIGLPIAATLAFEVTDLQRRDLPDGPDQRRRARGACHRDPDRLAHLHGAARPRHGRDGPRRPRLRRRRLRRRSPAPAGPAYGLALAYACCHRGGDALCRPRRWSASSSISTFRRTRPSSASPSPILVFAGLFQLVDCRPGASPPECCAASATRACR